VTLVRVDDSRCRPEVTCIWAGELAPVFSVTAGSFGTTVSEIQLGTIQTVSKIGAGYTFTLGTTTERTVTLMVSK
jgi:hypothetical protein